MDTRAAGLAAHRARRWRQAADALRAADAGDRLGPEELIALAEAAFLCGDATGCVQAYERAFSAFVAAGSARAAARAALLTAETLATRGALAGAGGWRARAVRVLDEHEESDCVERGYLLMPRARGHFAAGEYEDALRLARAAETIGRRHGDEDLVAFARHSQGRGLLRLQRLDEGLGVLDEVFVAVFPEGLAAPILTGLVACSVVQGCQQVGAFDRAAEWTAALSVWCDAQPELVQYSAECLVHRSEVLLRRGFWRDALTEAQAASRCADLAGGGNVSAAADYARGEAWRLLGRIDEAERSYRAAERAGHDPMPGLARLRLDQDRAGEAAAAMTRAVAMADDPLTEPRLLPTAVEAFLTADEPDSAAATDAAVGQLEELSRGWPTTGFVAAARQACGEVALARGDAAAAASALEEARRCWLSQEAPYEAARVRLLLGRACAVLGDRDAAAVHRSAAESDLAALRTRASAPSLAAGGELGLSPRETQVLRLVASGLTNRDVAGRLVLSERTVDRHVSNILTKLGVSSRTGAAARAHRHGLT